jgi:PGF-CTERM protein
MYEDVSLPTVGIALVTIALLTAVAGAGVAGAAGASDAIAANDTTAGNATTTSAPNETTTTSAPNETAAESNETTPNETTTTSAPNETTVESNETTPNESATFPAYTKTVAPNDTIEVTVSLSATDETRVQIGDRNTDYGANLTVTDGNDDGTVVLFYDLSAAGGNASAFAAGADADSVTVRDETSLEDSGIPEGNLPLYTAPADSLEDEMTLLIRGPMERETTAAGGTTTTAAGSTATATDEATATPTAAPTPTPTESPETTTQETSGDSGPGFGVAAALVALVAATGAAAVRKR